MAPDEGFFFFGKLEPLNVVAGVLADDKKLVVWQPLEAAAVKDWQNFKLFSGKYTKVVVLGKLGAGIAP